MGDVASQVKAARTGVAAIDRSSRGKILVRGNDRLAFLHNMLSNSISTLSPGKGCRAELLDERGHILGDLRVYVGAEDVRIDLEPGRADLVRATLEKYVIMDDATLEDVSAATAHFTVTGPATAGLIGALGGEVPRDLWSHGIAPLGGVGAWIARTHWASTSDLDIFVPAGDRESLQAVLEKAGATTIGDAAFEVLRIEAGVARQGAELDDVIALEARLDKEGAVSFTKGCYMGQEVMARIDSRGHVNRLLVGLALGAETVPGTHIKVDGKDVGRITSAAFSPTLGKTIALGYIRREHSEPGAAVTVGDVSGVVAALPFVP